MTRVRLLFDEDVPALLYRGLLRRHPEHEITYIGADGAPVKRTQDPDLLMWCEEHGWLLATSDKSTMPTHFGNHLQAGRHSPGVFVLPRHGEPARILADLILIIEASTMEDWRDRIVHLPL